MFSPPRFVSRGLGPPRLDVLDVPLIAIFSLLAFLTVVPLMIL